MNTLEDQLRDYAGFITDETQAYELGKTQSTHTAVLSAAEPKKRKRTLALVAVLAAGSATTFGVVSQFASGPKRQEVRFLPLSSTEQGHYAPSYLPAEFTTKSITKTTDTSGEFKKLMIFGKVKDDQQIVEGLFASQVVKETANDQLVGPGERVVTESWQVEIEGEMTPGRIVAIDDPRNPEASLRNVSVPFKGCGFLELGTLSSTTREKFAGYFRNFSCRDGQIMATPPQGLELLYEAPWTEGDATAYTLDYLRPAGGQLYFFEPSNSFPPELFALLNRFDGANSPNTTMKQIGGRTVGVSLDSRSGFTAYRWTQGNAQLMMNTSPEVSKEEAERVISSVRKLTDEEWDAMLKAHPLKLTTIVDGKVVTADSVAQ
jgi:hypothetical protein